GVLESGVDHKLHHGEGDRLQEWNGKQLGRDGQLYNLHWRSVIWSTGSMAIAYPGQQRYADSNAEFGLRSRHRLAHGELGRRLPSEQYDDRQHYAERRHRESKLGVHPDKCARSAGAGGY